MKPTLNLGAWRRLLGDEGGRALLLPAHHLVTHGVVTGMTGSGKTGLVTVLVEEALSAGIPTIVIDVKGDLPNLLLTFPKLEPDPLRRWVTRDLDAPGEAALLEACEKRRANLAEWSLGEAELQRYCDRTAMRVITPGSSAGERLHVLSALERRSARWDDDPESARDALSAAVSLVLRLLGRDPDPAKSREHVLLSVLAERRLAAGDNAEISALMADLLEPPIAQIGALPVNAFLKKTERARQVHRVLGRDDAHAEGGDFGAQQFVQRTLRKFSTVTNSDIESASLPTTCKSRPNPLHHPRQPAEHVRIRDPDDAIPRAAQPPLPPGIQSLPPGMIRHPPSRRVSRTTLENPRYSPRAHTAGAATALTCASPSFCGT